MMGAKYIYRMDDISPDMNWEQFKKFLRLFADNEIIPLLGVVPDNNDPNLSTGCANPDFWDIIKDLSDKGTVQIAQHGYRHKIEAIKSGFLGGTLFSEFAGLPYKEQYERIRRGKEIMNSKGLYTDIWMAPGHSFDQNTLKALKDSGFRYLTDGTALYPFKRNDLVFVPQQLWQPRPFSFGVFTICLHSNIADDTLYHKVKRHIKSGAEIISFKDAAEYAECIDNRKYSIPNIAFKIAYCFCRKVKHLITFLQVKKYLNTAL